MDDEKLKLYKQIVRSANEGLVLERMRVHGFWPPGEPIPADPPDEAKERVQIESDLHKLRKANSAVKDPDNALAKERKRRWEESKERRKQQKAKREAEAKKRREAWAAHKKDAIVSLGLGVSAGLEDESSDVEKLTKNGLPILHTGADVATLCGMSLSKIRWLTYHRKSASLVHYHRYTIPKKTGGLRNISAPKRDLAVAQRAVLVRILLKVSPESAAHGFVRGRSILTAAGPHTGHAVVVNLDLKDFFPTIGFRRVKGLFKSFGYSEHVATVLALLTTEPTRKKAELDGKVYHVALSERFLPQGACTSPVLTNLVCRHLDRRLGGLAAKAGFGYTRYADDLTFSGEAKDEIGRLLGAVRRVLVKEGFEENQKKTRVMRRGRRQEVTGLVVNQKVGVPRSEWRVLRAILHNAAKHGLASQNRDNHPNFAAHLRGRVAYVSMVDPARGELLRAALERALEKA